MAYKMKSTQHGVRKGEVHPVTFLKDKTYDLDDDLKEQFDTLDAVEDSSEDPETAYPKDNAVPIDKADWLDLDPAVLRHGELTAEEIVAKDQSPFSANPADQVEGKAEGELHEADEPDEETKSRKSKKQTTENR